MVNPSDYSPLPCGMAVLLTARTPKDKSVADAMRDFAGAAQEFVGRGKKGMESVGGLG